MSFVLQSKYKISLAIIFGAILIIGIVIPKLTVRDAVSLTEKEEECKQVDFSILYDNPIERLAIGVLGKTAVTEREDTLLRIKAYTLFRIPIGESIVNCDTGSSYKIPQTESGINQAIEQAQYCEVKSDCVQVDAKCPFGCNVFVNKREVERIQTFIDSHESRCAYVCVALKSYDCVNNRCEISLNPGVPAAVPGLGVYQEVPIENRFKVYQSDEFGISFSYPEEYLLFEIQGEGAGGREYYIVTLMPDTPFIRDAIAGTLEGDTEWPTSIHFSFYREPNLTISLEEWVRTNQLQSNFDPSDPAQDAVLTPATVAGVPALQYRVGGLYWMDTTTFTYSDWVVLATVDSFTPEGNSKKIDFENILSTIALSE